jgi:hypothetical protein
MDLRTHIAIDEKRLYPRVATAPFAATIGRLRDEGHPMSEIAAWCGVYKDATRSAGDGGWLTAVLRRRDLAYHTAIRLSIGLGLDPVDVGL